MKLISRTLGDICDEVRGTIRTGPFGSQLHEADYLEQGTPVVMPKNIVDGKISVDDIARIGDNDAHRLSQHKLHIGDIVYGRRGDIGRRGFITQKEEGWICGTGCLRISIGYRVLDPIFLYYYLGNPKVVAWVTSQAIGATLPNLNTSIIRRIPVKYPHLSVQHKIAAILSAYDDLIENNTRRIAILEEMAQAIYQEWFVRFRYPGHEKDTLVESELGMIPEEWTLTELRQIATVYRGRSYGNTNLVKEGGLPFLNLKCIERDGGFRHDGIKQYQGPYKETHTARAGDIIMGVTDVTQERRLIARAARVPKNEQSISVFSMDLVKIVPSDERCQEYLYSMLRFSNFSAEVKQHANGANVLHLAPSRIEKFVFPLAPVSLCILFSKISKSIYEASDVLQLKNANLRRTRDMLLPKLISGEIDVESLDIDIPDIVEPEERQETPIMAHPEPMDATQLALPLLQY